jgi:hypothetical protein
MDPVVTETLNGEFLDEGNPSAPLTSPFLGSGFLADTSAPSALHEVPMPGLVSPFTEAFATGGSEDEQLLEELLGELQDETFDEAVEALVDEAAALQLSSPWSSEAAGGSAPLDAWAARLTSDAQRLFDHLELAFADRAPATIAAGEIDLAAAQALSDPLSPASEQLFGGILNKIKNAVTTVASTGIGILGKITGLGQITAILRKLVEPMVRRVVNTVLKKVPESLRGPAMALASKLGIPTAGAAGTAGELAEDFDRQLAEALIASDQATVDQLVAAADDAARASTENPVASLDVARASLAEQLAQATPGEPPVVQVEQFIPAVMAAMPLIKAAARVIGTGRIKRMLAGPLAAFIAPFVGSQAAGALAPHIAGAGMKLLGLEREDPATLGTEALVSTLEETVRQVLSLDQESLADDLRFAAEVQEAFTEAAARYLPDHVLREELEAGAEESERGGWILMPRYARPHFRFRAYSLPSRVLLSRPTARAIVFTDGETLEDRLLDDGVREWPAEAEVRLFEAIPGTQLGHLSAGEADPEAPEAVSTAEFGELTPEAAGILLRAPALGRRMQAGGRGGTVSPGQRFFRVVAPGQARPHRRVRRLRLRLDMSTSTPVLRVHLRIGERLAHTIAAQLDQRAHAQVVATLRRLLGDNARRAMATRLARLRALNTPTPLPEDRRRALAETVAEAMITTVSKELPAAGAALTKAAQDPATGLTLTFAFPLTGGANLQAATPGTPTLTIRPGYRHD